jgi:hypothetical protein
MLTRTHAGMAIMLPVIKSPWATFSAKEMRTLGGPEITVICLAATFICGAALSNVLAESISTKQVVLINRVDLNRSSFYRIFVLLVD